MQKNEGKTSFSNISNESKESIITKNIQILPQLEKDICILINYIRTNPLDYANNLMKNSKNKNLTEEQIDLIKIIKEKYSKEQLLPFHEIPEISLAAKNLLNIISQSETKSGNKNQKKFKASSLNLRTRLSKYGIRTGRIFSNVITGIENPEDIVNHILKGENGRNMLLSNKMKFIGIGCCILPSNKICSVIDIVQEFVSFGNNQNNKNENAFSQKMNIIINNNNSNTSNNNEFIPKIINTKPNNQRKKNIMYEKTYDNNDKIFKTPEFLTSTDSYEQKSYKSYNIIINNNNIIPIKNNLNNISELNENIFENKEIDVGYNSSKIGMSKSKSIYRFRFNSGNNRNSNFNRYQKLNRKEKLEILHKINQSKNNNSISKNKTNFERLIPLSPDYSKIKKSSNLNNNFFSPISPYYSKKDNNLETESNYFEYNETMPNYKSPILDNDIKMNDIKNDLIKLKEQLKEELKIEVKNEIRNEIKNEYKENNHQNHNRNASKNNIIYHKRYKSDFFKKNDDVINPINKNKVNKINLDNYRSFNAGNGYKMNLNGKENHKINNKNEIKKLIRLYNKEKDFQRNQYNNYEVDNLNNNDNKINIKKIPNFFFKYKSNNKININTNPDNKEMNNITDKQNLFLIKYQKAKPKDKTFKLNKNKIDDKKASKCYLKKNIEKQDINNNINNKQAIIEKNNLLKKEGNNIYSINSYRNKNNENKKTKEQSIELYLNDEKNIFKEYKRCKTPEKKLKSVINCDDIKLNSDVKNFKTSSYFKYKNYKL